MLSLDLGPIRDRLRVLCLGAHSDDIEIGCAGTLLRWLAELRSLEVTWAVVAARGQRAEEARASAQALMSRAARLDIVLGDFRDAWLPADYAGAKAFLQDLRTRAVVDVILTHHGADAHQDHRLVSELTWQTWRDHLILEYEIPKYEGDLGHPNLFVPLSPQIAYDKVNHLLAHFGSQHSKDWFNAETFLSLMRLRGLESRAPNGFAEAFHVRKIVL